MSKMKELSAVLDELVTCGETLISTANALKDIFSNDADTHDSPAPSSKNTKKPAALRPETVIPESKPESEPQPLTKEAVRGILAAKSAAGYGDEIRALLRKYGAKQLKQVDPSDYAALVKDAEVIGTETDTDITGDTEATAAEEDSDE